MSCPTRDKILERIGALLGSRHIVRWSDARTSRGEFEGSQWTIDVFDVAGEETFELGRRIAAYRRELSREYGIGLVVVPHTPEATDQHFPWVRKGEVDGCEGSTYATAATIAVSNAPFAHPRTTVEFGIQR